MYINAFFFTFSFRHQKLELRQVAYSLKPLALNSTEIIKIYSLEMIIQKFDDLRILVQKLNSSLESVSHKNIMHKKLLSNLSKKAVSLPVIPLQLPSNLSKKAVSLPVICLQLLSNLSKKAVSLPVIPLQLLWVGPCSSPSNFRWDRHQYIQWKVQFYVRCGNFARNHGQSYLHSWSTLLASFAHVKETQSSPYVDQRSVLRNDYKLSFGCILEIHSRYPLQISFHGTRNIGFFFRFRFLLYEQFMKKNQLNLYRYQVFKTKETVPFRELKPYQ